MQRCVKDYLNKKITNAQNFSNPNYLFKVESTAPSAMDNKKMQLICVSREVVVMLGEKLCSGSAGKRFYNH